MLPARYARNRRQGILTHKEYEWEEWCSPRSVHFKYGKLLSKALPKRIETDAEFDHFVEVMEDLSRAAAQRKPSPEEQALHALLSTLVKEYDDRV